MGGGHAPTIADQSPRRFSGAESAVASQAELGINSSTRSVICRAESPTYSESSVPGEESTASGKVTTRRSFVIFRRSNGSASRSGSQRSTSSVSSESRRRTARSATARRSPSRTKSPAPKLRASTAADRKGHGRVAVEIRARRVIQRRYSPFAVEGLYDGEVFGMGVAISDQVSEDELPDQVAAREAGRVTDRGQAGERLVRTEQVLVRRWAIAHLTAVFHRERVHCPIDRDAIEASNEQAGIPVSISDQFARWDQEAGAASGVEEECLVLDQMRVIDGVELEDVALTRTRDRQVDHRGAGLVLDSGQRCPLGVDAEVDQKVGKSEIADLLECDPELAPQSAATPDGTTWISPIVSAPTASSSDSSSSAEVFTIRRNAPSRRPSGNKPLK